MSRVLRGDITKSSDPIKYWVIFSQDRSKEPNTHANNFGPKAFVFFGPVNFHEFGPSEALSDVDPDWVGEYLSGFAQESWYVPSSSKS